jgi:hypothetical protein
MIPSPTTKRQFKRVLFHWFKEIASGRLHVPKGDNSLMSWVEDLLNNMLSQGGAIVVDELAEYKELADRAKETFEDGASGAKADQELVRQLADDVKRMEYIWDFFLTEDEKAALADAGYWSAGDLELALVLRDEVHQFAQLMEIKMRKHDPVTRWKKSKRTDLFLALKKEMDKLEPLAKYAGVNEKTITPEAIASQAADVANFAMMIADVCGGLKWITEKETAEERARRTIRRVSPPASVSRTTPAEQQS